MAKQRAQQAVESGFPFSTWPRSFVKRFEEGTLTTYNVRTLVEAAGQCAVTSEEDDLYVDLDQSAACVHASKRTLERMKAAGKLPPPDRPSMGGRSPDLWRRSVLWPVLEDLFRMDLSGINPRMF